MAAENTPRRAATRTLAAHVAPAIVWHGGTPYVASTDTSPGLDLAVSEEGGIATPLDGRGRERMAEAMADDAARVLRIVRDMARSAARFVPAEVEAEVAA